MTVRDLVEASTLAIFSSVAFTVCKAFGVVDWSWPWVLLPLAANVLIVAAYLLFYALPLTLIGLVDRFVRRERGAESRGESA